MSAEMATQEFGERGLFARRGGFGSRKTRRRRFDPGERDGVGQPELHGENFFDDREARRAIRFAAMVFRETGAQVSEPFCQRASEIIGAIGHPAKFRPIVAESKPRTFEGTAGPSAPPRGGDGVMACVSKRRAGRSRLTT